MKKRASTAGKTGSVEISPGLLLDFVNKLAHDDKFRQAMAKAPAKALKRYGIDARSISFPDRIRLPSKKALQKAMSGVTLGAQFRQPLAGVVFFEVFFAFLLFHLVVTGYDASPAKAPGTRRRTKSG